MNTTEAINPVRPSALVDLANAAIQAGTALFILGQGGAGKTSIATKIIGPALGREVWYVNLSGSGPQEVIGYGIPRDNGDMDFAAPAHWPTLARVGDKPVLLLLDELTDYDSAVNAALRSTIYAAAGNRYIGPHKLGTNILVVLTGNRRGDGTKSKVEDAPLTERCIKCTIEPNVADWLEWYNGQPDLVATGSHIPAFLKFGTSTGDGVDFFNPPIKMPYDGSPHPCPRTWEAACRITSLHKSAPEVYRSAVRGLVGDRAATALFGFLQHIDKLPDIAALKADPEGFQVPNDPAAQFALVSACLNTATAGIKDLAIAVHSGAYDWLVSLLVRCRGDIREFGALSAVRRGIPLDQHPRSHDLIIG